MSPSSPRRSVDSSESSTTPTSKRSELPAPQHDSVPRPFTGTRYQHRRGSTASSFSAVGGSLDIGSHSRGDSVRESSQNAISTLLTPPIVRTGLLPHTSGPIVRPPSTRDIPPVTLTNIPHADLNVFKTYLSQAGSLYDAFQRAKAAGDDGASDLFRKEKEAAKADELSNILGDFQSPSSSRPSSGLGRPSAGSRQGSLASLTTVESPQLQPRSSAGFPRRNAQPAPLSTIPSVYFEEDFHLENPRTFDVVSERSEIAPAPRVGAKGEHEANGSIEKPTPRKTLATNAILQEKLSWYMDTVELHLISAISSASTSFFATLGSLKDLHSEAADSIERIKGLRDDLAQLDQHMAIGGLKIVSMKRRRENLHKLGQAMAQLHRVVNGLTGCEKLVDEGHYETAIDCLQSLESLIAGEAQVSLPGDDNVERPRNEGPLYDLRQVKALGGMSEGMDQIRLKIGKGFEARLLRCLMSDLQQHMQTVPAKDTLQRWAFASHRSRGDHARLPSVVPTYLKTSDGLYSELLSNLNGLNRANHTAPALSAFRDAVMREMKAVIRHPLPSSNDDDVESVTSASTRGGRQFSQQEKSSILARNLRALEAKEAEELLVKIYTAVSEALRRVGTQVKVLLDVTSRVGMSPGLESVKSPPKSPNVAGSDGRMDKSPLPAAGQGHKLQEELAQALDLSTLLGQAVDVAQAQITKILKVRSEQTSHLPLDRFLRYFTLNRLFADECEAASGRSGAALKTVVNGHIREYVQNIGDSERQRLAQTMESDKWEAQDFGERETAFLARILDGMTKDPADWLKDTRIWEDTNETGGTTAGATVEMVNGNGSVATMKTRSAFIDEQKFMLVGSAIVALEGIDHFEHLIAGIPSMTGEIATSLLDYLKLFNSRSSQLILGAGATRTAGLKNITTKHLALASQALSFIIALIPYTREFIRRHLPNASSSPTLAEFDKVKRLYQEHQSGIHDKLVEIMSGRASMHVATMRKIDWDKPRSGDEGGAEEAPSPYIETLTKETSTLHRVLSKHLPESEVRMIVGPVFRSYREQWSKAFEEAVVQSEAGKARMLRDAKFFESRLSKIDGSGDLGSHIVDIVESKIVGDTNSPATMTSAEAVDGRNSIEAKEGPKT